MMGRQGGDQSQLFYLFNLERRIPAFHLLRRINPVVTRILASLRGELASFYGDIGHRIGGQKKHQRHQIDILPYAKQVKAKPLARIDNGKRAPFVGWIVKPGRVRQLRST